MTRLSLIASFRGLTGSRVGGVLTAVALLVGSSGGAVWTAPPTATAAAGGGEKRAVDDRTIAHVLNRMAFGPAPGDIERVRAMGLSRYIDEQLQPQKLADGAMRERLAKFETLTMTSRDIGERYASLEELRRELQLRQPAAGARPDRHDAGEMTGHPADAPTRQRPRPQSGMPSPQQPGEMNEMAGAAQPGAPRPDAADREELLANLTPEQRQRVMELRRQNQQVLGEMSEQKLLRAVYSERQLEEVLVDFWFNHFNVFAGKGPTRIYLAEYEREAIRPHVLGNFRDLLGATAHSPAMLFYLDNWQSSDPDAAAARGAGAGALRRNPMRDDGMGGRTGRMRPGGNRARGGADAMPGGGQMSDEQRARALQARQQRQRRGINENYARELMELHTLGVGGGYTQQDIIEVAKAFTGWTIQQPRRGGGFEFDERRHVKGPKTILGKKIDKGGVEDGEAVLDLLAAHPSTATLIATKLTRRFVADEPPKALVERAAAKFRSTNGNLREVVRTILTSPEFTSAEAMRAKVKTPFEFVASALRATGARIDDGTVLVRNLQGLGMPLYMAQPPTGYIDRADVWVNTGALLNRMNFAVALVNNRLRGVQVDLSPIIGRNPPEVAAARDALVASLLSNEVSDATRATIEKGGEVTQVAALTLGSPEFQRR